MAGRIIKIQLCPPQRLRLKEGEAGGQAMLGHCPSLWSRLFCHSLDVKSSLSRERLPAWGLGSSLCQAWPKLPTPGLGAAGSSEISCLTSQGHGGTSGE